MFSPEDVEHSAGCQTSKNSSSKPQDLDIRKIEHMVTLRQTYKKTSVRSNHPNPIPVKVNKPVNYQMKLLAVPSFIYIMLLGYN